jgi:hypothetical protein
MRPESLLALGGLVGLCGCAMPGLYTNAFPHKGSVQPTIVLEPVRVTSSASRAVPVSRMTEAGDIHIRLRVELPGPCDLGLMFGVVRAGADAKCALFSNDSHAIALDVGILATFFLELTGSTRSVWLNSAALYSWRHSSGFAVTLNTGASYWFVGDSLYTLDFSSASPSFRVRGPYARAGIGFETPGWFSLQPEFNVFQQIAAGDRVTFMTFGFGFHFNHPQPAERLPSHAPAKWN